MRRLTLITFAFSLLFSCGGSVQTDETTDDENYYSAESAELKAAKELKEKLISLNNSFNELASKELEESVCPETKKIDFQAPRDELDVLLMTNYMLANFSEDSVAFDYRMPEKDLANGTPLTDFYWLNYNQVAGCEFDLYRSYPDLVEVPKKVQVDDGEEVSYQKEAEEPGMLLRASENGLVGIVAIVDYEPPAFISEDSTETGYMMGYVMFANWENASLDCMIPFLTTNRDSINFGGANEVGEGDKMAGTVIMEKDLQSATYETIGDIVKQRTGFTGTVYVNNPDRIKKY